MLCSLTTRLPLRQGKKCASNVSDVDSILIGFIDCRQRVLQSEREKIVEAKFAFMASNLVSDARCLNSCLMLFSSDRWRSRCIDDDDDDTCHRDDNQAIF